MTYLEGNKLVNGLILGISELISGIFAGILVNYTDAQRAFYICAIIGIGFNVLTLYVVPVGSYI